MKNNELNLYFEEQNIGLLRERSGGLIEFTYSKKWLDTSSNFAISQSMPLRPAAYLVEAQNYFSNLLPEGEVRIAIAGKLGISVENDFRLLDALGGECAGALSIGKEPRIQQQSYTEISPKKLHRMFVNREFIFSSLQAEDSNIRLSLAGAQDKIPVLYKDGHLYLPQGNSASSHILKLPSHRFKHLPENECLMGLFAINMGLNFARPQLVDLAGINAYLIERFDRVKTAAGYTRLHQEDFCQALGYSYKVKYEKDNGPSFKQSYSCVESCSSMLPEDLEKLIRWLIFNVIVGNCDAHAKNISLLRAATGKWSLSPHYDIVATRAYGKLSTSLAMSIGGATDSGTVTGTHWKNLAKDVQMGAHFILEVVHEMAETSASTLQKTMDEFEALYGASPILIDIKSVVATQSRRLLTQLKK